MKLSPERAVQILKEVLPEVLVEAGRKGLEIQGQETIQSSRKMETGNAKADLVTEADPLLQSMILSALARTHLRYCLLAAEEHTPEVELFSGEESIRITVDPINGTKRFNERSKMWEIMVGAHTPEHVLYSCSHAPGFDFTLQIDEDDGIQMTGSMPMIQADMTEGGLVIARKPDELLAQQPVLREFFADGKHTFIPEDPSLPEVGGRIGRNMSFVSGLVRGVMINRPNLYDGLLPAHFAQHSGGRVITFGRKGEFCGRTDYFDTIDYKGAQVFTGGYVAMNR